MFSLIFKNMFSDSICKMMSLKLQILAAEPQWSVFLIIHLLTYAHLPFYWGVTSDRMLILKLLSDAFDEYQSWIKGWYSLAHCLSSSFFPSLPLSPFLSSSSSFSFFFPPLPLILLLFFSLSSPLLAFLLPFSTNGI